jgi:hypothetical protein
MEDQRAFAGLLKGNGMLRRYGTGLFLLLALSGCGLPLRSDIVVNAPRPLQPTVGMSRAQVAALMDRKIVVGYGADPVDGTMKPVESGNLYSSEKVVVRGEEYWVDSYISGAGGGKPVSRGTLIPMIFKGDVLAGQGRDALDALTAPHEK